MSVWDDGVAVGRVASSGAPAHDGDTLTLEGVVRVPTLTAIDPTSAVIGGPDVTLRCTGSFPPDATIYFNGGAEVTRRDGEDLTTIVKASAAAFLTPGDYPVDVHSLNGDSTSLTFALTAAE